MDYNLTQICNFTLLSCRKTVFTLKSIPTVETKAEVKESSAYLKEYNKIYYYSRTLLQLFKNFNFFYSLNFWKTFCKILT